MKIRNQWRFACLKGKIQLEGSILSESLKIMRMHLKSHWWCCWLSWCCFGQQLQQRNFSRTIRYSWKVQVPKGYGLRNFKNEQNYLDTKIKISHECSSMSDFCQTEKFAETEMLSFIVDKMMSNETTTVVHLMMAHH